MKKPSCAINKVKHMLRKQYYLKHTRQFPANLQSNWNVQNLILYFVFCGSETWYLVSREERKFGYLRTGFWGVSLNLKERKFEEDRENNINKKFNNLD